MRSRDVALGARVPRELKERMDRFCREHGLKMGHLVKTALLDKLGELEEEIRDREFVRERLEDPEFVSEADYSRYMKRRLGPK